MEGPAFEESFGYRATTRILSRPVEDISEAMSDVHAGGLFGRWEVSHQTHPFSVVMPAVRAGLIIETLS